MEHIPAILNAIEGITTNYAWYAITIPALVQPIVSAFGLLAAASLASFGAYFLYKKG